MNNKGKYKYKANPKNKYDSIERIIYDVETFGILGLNRHKLVPYLYYELLRCYGQIKMYGKTTTIYQDIEAIFEKIKDIQIKTSSKHIGWLIKDKEHENNLKPKKEDKYSKIKTIIMSYGESEIDPYGLDLDSFVDLKKCYKQIKRIGITTTSYSRVKELFEEMDNIKISDVKTGWIIKDEDFKIDTVNNK